MELCRRELLWSFALFLVLAAISLLLRRRKLAHVSLLLVLACAGGLLQVRDTIANPVINAAPGEDVVLEGCVIEPASLSPGRDQFILEIAPRARVRVSIYTKPGEPPLNVRYGQRIEADV